MRRFVLLSILLLAPVFGARRTAAVTASTSMHTWRRCRPHSAHSDAYFKGGFWLLLWDFLSTVVGMWLLLRFRWSASMRNVSERLTRFRSLQIAIYWIQFLVVFVLRLRRDLRIPLNDNLLKRCTLPEIETTMGHEMGHYVLHHAYKGLVMFGVLMVIGFAFPNWGILGSLARWGEQWDIRGITV